jgi:dolichyl-phosphate-mannose--protein O-mannosyl transferase
MIREVQAYMTTGNALIPSLAFYSKPQNWPLAHNATQFLINKDKNRSQFLFTFLHPFSNEGDDGINSPLGASMGYL